MITTDDLYVRLNDIFRDVFDDPSIIVREDMTADDVENWDSLTHINLIVAIEKKFKIRFTTGEVSGLKNVGELIQLISKKANQ